MPAEQVCSAQCYRSQPAFALPHLKQKRPRRDRERDDLYTRFRLKSQHGACKILRVVHRRAEDCEIATGAASLHIHPVRAGIILAIFLTASTAIAGSVEFSYENFYIDRDIGRARIILKITNGTAKPLAMVIAECAFLNADQKAVDVATAIATNVPAHGHAYADAWSADVAGIEHADCRISSSR